MFSYGILVYVDVITRFKSCQFHGHNMEMHKISLGCNIETMFVHPCAALWQVLALNPMRQNLWTENFFPQTQF